VSFICCGAALPHIEKYGAWVASRAALAATKLIAIAGRGERRDFIDLYALLKDGLRMKSAMACLRRGFPEYPLGMVLRALTEFGMAERVPMPPECSFDWTVVKKQMRGEVRALLKG
jgi:hypothetical protein